MSTMNTAKKSLTDAQKAIGCKRGKTAHLCNRFSTIWAAILGCEGYTTAWTYWRQGTEVTYTCGVCAAHELQNRTEPATHQARLAELSAAAGVVNYRSARWRRRPDGTLEITHSGILGWDGPR